MIIDIETIKKIVFEDMVEIIHAIANHSLNRSFMDRLDTSEESEYSNELIIFWSVNDKIHFPRVFGYDSSIWGHAITYDNDRIASWLGHKEECDVYAFTKCYKHLWCIEDGIVRHYELEGLHFVLSSDQK